MNLKSNVSFWNPENQITYNPSRTKVAMRLQKTEIRVCGEVERTSTFLKIKIT